MSKKWNIYARIFPLKTESVIIIRFHCREFYLIAIMIHSLKSNSLINSLCINAQVCEI